MNVIQTSEIISAAAEFVTALPENELKILIINAIIGIAALVIVILGLLLSVTDGRLQKPTRSYFIWFFSIMTVYMTSNLVELLTWPAYATVNIKIAALYTESISSSLLLVLLAIYLLYCCSESWKDSSLFRSVLLIWGIYFALLTENLFTGRCYFYDRSGEYHRGSMYPLLLVPLILIMLILLAGVIRRRKRLTESQLGAFLAYIILPMAAMLVQMQVYGVLLTVLAAAVAAVIMFFFIFNEQIDMYIKQAETVAEQELQIKVLQMRPHFIYNTMTSIYYLCEDSPRAQEVIRDFTTYLQKNFSAIASTEPIPFEDELKHTKAYLAVEKAQFEDQLTVEYDIEHTAFRLPPLTVQPIVENAIKHGLDPEYAPLHIRISSRLTGDGSEVIIEDNGIGIARADGNGSAGSGRADGPREDVGLGSTRERLKRMCGGTLNINSRPGGGTVVSILIPSGNESAK